MTEEILVAFEGTGAKLEIKINEDWGRGSPSVVGEIELLVGDPIVLVVVSVPEDSVVVISPPVSVVGVSDWRGARLAGQAARRPAQRAHRCRSTGHECTGSHARTWRI